MTMPSEREKEIMALQIGRVNEQLKPFGFAVTTLECADIAEELARALDMAIENARDDSAYVWSEVFRIRDKYLAIARITSPLA